MYVSRLNFYTIPGKSGEVEQQLKALHAMVERQGGSILSRQAARPLSLLTMLLTVCWSRTDLGSSTKRGVLIL
jgi:hypothetical protein